MASRADKMASGVNFSNFGKATDLKSRIWFTIGALIVFRLLSFVPLPGVDPIAQAALYANNAAGGVLDIFNTFSGGSLERMSLIALGVMPYITASIVVQLATTMSPTLNALKKEGESGRKKTQPIYPLRHCLPVRRSRAISWPSAPGDRCRRPTPASQRGDRSRACCSGSRSQPSASSAARCS